MSDSQNAGFGKFVPGFDFLQNLAKGASQSVPQMPNLSNWIAPTLNEEELDKRIAELKAVHFWLDQNSKALGATVQALEVQKMTLATLKGMNFNIADVANAFKLKAAETVVSGVQKVADKATSTAQAAKPVAAAAGAALVDPIHLWNSLTQQFSHIAGAAMAEAGKATAVDLSKNVAKEVIKETVKATKKVAASARPASATAKKTVKKVTLRSR